MEIKDAERITLIFWGFDLTGMSDSEVHQLYVRETIRRWRAVAKACRESGRAFTELAQSLRKFQRSALSSR
jgi:hypothetical protein